MATEYKIEIVGAVVSTAILDCIAAESTPAVAKLGNAAHPPTK
jgi:hypothetical protein